MALEFAGTFVVSDENVIDRHSERVMVKGIQLGNFKKNSVMLYNHMRTGGYFSDDATPKVIGEWQNLKKEEGKLYADAYITNSTELGRDVLALVNDGVLKSASIGFRFLAYSDDDSDKLIGQKGYTVTKSELLEISIVDIPANPNAVAVKSLIANKSEEEQDLNFIKTGYITPIIKQEMSVFNKLKNFFSEDNPTEEGLKALLNNDVAEQIAAVQATVIGEDAIKGLINQALTNASDELDAKIKTVQDKADALETENKGLKAELEKANNSIKTISGDIASKTTTVNEPPAMPPVEEESDESDNTAKAAKNYFEKRRKNLK